PTGAIVRVSRSRLGTSAGTKPGPSEPAVSTTRSVAALEKTQTSPEPPGRTSTAAAVVVPARKLRFDAVGRSRSHGNTVTNPSAAGGPAVTCGVGAPSPGTGTGNTPPAGRKIGAGTVATVGR